MTRQRKEILKKLDEIESYEAAEIEMGCGFGTEHIVEAFSPIKDGLMKALAATYNMTIVEYENMLYDVATRIPFAY